MNSSCVLHSLNGNRAILGIYSITFAVGCEVLYLVRT